MALFPVVGLIINYIANANVLLKGGQALLDANTLSDSERAQVSLYMGHAYFSRAFAYFELARHFCKNYEPATASSRLRSSFDIGI